MNTIYDPMQCVYPWWFHSRYEALDANLAATAAQKDHPAFEDTGEWLTNPAFVSAQSAISKRLKKVVEEGYFEGASQVQTIVNKWWASC